MCAACLGLVSGVRFPPAMPAFYEPIPDTKQAVVCALADRTSVPLFLTFHCSYRRASILAEFGGIARDSGLWSRSSTWTIESPVGKPLSLRFVTKLELAYLFVTKYWKPLKLDQTGGRLLIKFVDCTDFSGDLPNRWKLDRGRFLQGSNFVSCAYFTGSASFPFSLHHYVRKTSAWIKFNTTRVMA